MPRMFKHFRGLFLFVMLFSVTARVFTGASEAQVNFTSLIVDQHMVSQDEPDEHLLLHHASVKNAIGASSLPDKHHTYATYKKYVTPDKSFSPDITVSRDQSLRHERIGYQSAAHLHTSIYLPLSNSPPAVVSAHSFTYTTTTDASVALENNFGEIEIDYSAGGLSSFQL